MIHGKPRKAAIEAGYSEATADSVHATVLKSRLVIKELRRRRTEWLQDEERDANWSREEVSICANVNMADYGHWDETAKNWVVDLSGCTREQLACIQEISYDVNGRPKIRVVDKKAFLELKLRAEGGLDADDSKSSSKHQPYSVQDIDEKLRQYRTQQVTINNQYNIVAQERQKLPETIDAQ